jgi:glycosyltransferase involved in cell wall biosynthesis
MYWLSRKESLLAQAARPAMELVAERSVVLIPARNEAASILEVICDVRTNFKGEIVVIDDASEDGTASIARSAGAKVLRMRFPQGAWGAIQTGLLYGLKRGHRAAVSLDADGQHSAEAVPELLAALERGQANVMIGAFTQRASRARQLAWKLFRGLTGFHVEDLTSGLRAYDRRAMEILVSREAYLLAYQDVGVLLLLRKSGLVIEEMCTTMFPRRDGCSRVFHSWWAVARYMISTSVLCAANVAWRPSKRSRRGPVP